VLATLLVEKVPAAQSTHSPPAMDCWPFEQGVQVEALPAEEFPAEQFEQVVAPASEKVPLGQIVHYEAPPTAAVPARH